MKKTKTLFLLISIFLAASALNAGSFEEDVKRAQGKVKAEAVPEPTLTQAVTHLGGAKWWSVNFFGSAHRAIIKATLKLIDGNISPEALSQAPGDAGRTKVAFTLN